MKAELLIDADGLHSGVRALVFATDEVTRTDLGVLAAAFFPEQVTANVVRERTVTTISAPSRTVAVTRLGTDRTAAFFTYRSSAPEVRARRQLPVVSSCFPSWVGDGNHELAMGSRK